MPLSDLNRELDELNSDIIDLRRKIDNIEQKLDIFSIEEDGGVFYLKVKTVKGIKKVQIT